MPLDRRVLGEEARAILGSLRLVGSAWLLAAEQPAALRFRIEPAKIEPAKTVPQ